MTTKKVKSIPTLISHYENNRRSVQVTKIYIFPPQKLCSTLCTTPSNYYLNCMSFDYLTEKTADKSLELKRLMPSKALLFAVANTKKKIRRIKPN